MSQEEKYLPQCFREDHVDYIKYLNLEVAKSLQSTCTHLTRDSPSVKRAHSSGRKHQENVKDYYQKRMQGQAQSLMDRTVAFQQGKTPPTPFSAPPRAGAMIPPPPSFLGPPCPSMMPAPHMGGPPVIPMKGPPPPGMLLLQ